MKIKKSILELRNFWILESKLQIIPPTADSSFNVNIPLDIEFEIFENTEKFKIVVELEGNNGRKKQPGYSFKVISEGQFIFSEKIEPNEINNYLLFSALPLMISNIRAYLSNLTSLSPFGKYTLPAVDMNDLIEQKRKLINQLQ